MREFFSFQRGSLSSSNGPKKLFEGNIKFSLNQENLFFGVQATSECSCDFSNGLTILFKYTVQNL